MFPPVLCCLLRSKISDPLKCPQLHLLPSFLCTAVDEWQVNIVSFGKIPTCPDRLNCVTWIACELWCRLLPVRISKTLDLKHLPDEGISTDLNYGEGVVITTPSKEDSNRESVTWTSHQLLQDKILAGASTNQDCLVPCVLVLGNNLVRYL